MAGCQEVWIRNWREKNHQDLPGSQEVRSESENKVYWMRKATGVQSGDGEAWALLLIASSGLCSQGLSLAVHL